MCENNSKYNYLYYPDIHKKYKQYANKTGEKLLKILKNKVSEITLVLKEKILEQKKDPEKQVKEGVKIYIEKSSKSKGATWTDEEYQHLGFQIVYINVKSIQRFTEMYNLLIRGYNKNYFNNLKDELNIVSVGGGPAFELFAMKIFFHTFYPKIKINFASIDLNNYWVLTNKLLNIKFIQGSFYDKEIIKEITKFDISVMSYVVYHYFNKTKRHKDIINMLKNKNKMLLVNSRLQSLPVIRDVTNSNKNIYLYNLTGDNRQCILSRIKLDNTLKERRCNIPFKDVPY
jgi:hypothetical protein